jgi:DNA recombination protein RmuC
MTDIAILILGFSAGVFAGWYIGVLRGRSAVAGESAALGEVRGQLAAKDAELAAIRQALELEKVTGAESRARLESAREHFAEQRKQLTRCRPRSRRPSALSATALKSSNEQFLTLAETRLKPVRELMERYEKQIKELEEARANAYGGLTEKLATMQQGAERLSSETSQLVAALRSPGAKGKWGEVTLQRIVELSGMSPHCDFTTQSTQDSGQRPDLIVNLPGGRQLAVDSKVNTSAYLDAINATTDDERKRGLERYVTAVRTTLKSLSGKEYWKQFNPSPEFVVMFMPGEAFFSAAVSADPDLLVDGVDERVILASPTTLIALLMAVRHGWQQQLVADNAQRIAEAGRELYDRLCGFVDHLDDVRGGIQKAADAYNKAVGNWSSRTLLSAKKLKELGAAEAGKEVAELPIIETQLRVLPPQEDAPASESRRAV